MKQLICWSMLLLLVPTLSVTAKDKLDRSKVPTPGPAPVLSLGDYETFTLDNGLKVFVVENRKLPRLSFQLLLDRDPISEGDKVGYVSATGQLLRRGTESMTKSELDEKIDFMGANISTGASGISGSCLSRYGDEVLAIMADIAQNASLPADELEKIKKEMKDNIRSSLDNPGWIAGNLVSVLTYGEKHPYGEVMTEASVDTFTLDDVRTYYETFWRPNIGYLAVIGDITPEKAKTMVKKHFGSWEKGEVPSYDYSVPAPPEKTRVAVVHKEGAVQTVLRVVHPIELEPANPDVIPARVTNTILGGGTFRLYNNLREDKGYTYGAYSSLNANELVGRFTASASVRNEVTAGSVEELLHEMKRIREEPVPSEELTMVKSYITGDFARDLENPGTVANYAINTLRFGLPDDYYDNYLSNLASVTPEQVTAMAKKYIYPERSWIVAVGDADALTEALAPYGEVTRYDVYGRPWKAPEVSIPEGLTAEKVIDRYLEARGGVEKIAAISNAVISGSMSMGGMALSMVNRVMAPNKSAKEMTMNDQVMVNRVFDGEKGVTTQMGQTVPFSPEEVAATKIDGHLIPETVYSEEGVTLSLDGVEDVEGKPAYVIEVTLPGGQVSKRAYDVTTGLLVKTSRAMNTPQGEMTQVMTYSDYREVSGVQFPYLTKMSMGPQKVDIKVDEVKVNTEMDPSIFEVDQ